jgi:hypothetical protein
MVKVHGLHKAIILGKVSQRRRVYDCGFLALKPFCCDGCGMLNDLRLGAICGPWLYWSVGMLIYNLPFSVVTSSWRKFIGRDLDKTFAIGIRYPVARWKDLEIVHGLYPMIVLVVVDLSEDLVLYDLVFVWLDQFVSDGYFALARLLPQYQNVSPRRNMETWNVPGANWTSLS